MAGRGEHVRVP